MFGILITYVSPTRWKEAELDQDGSWYGGVNAEWGWSGWVYARLFGIEASISWDPIEK